MPSKKSKSHPLPLSPWRVEPACSEAGLARIAGELASELSSGDRVLLEGPMGAGKTTFARALLAGLGVEQPPEGSPSFAIAHEYRSPKGEVIHMDFYRLRSEAEIEEAGLAAYFWERQAITITEWLSDWPEFRDAVLRAGGRFWTVKIDFSARGDAYRDLEIRSGSL